ncbi:MAG: zinc-binding dehydrogenase [Candidatus Latescibacterota bacterium]|nr:zinc-binding dehydrogenase [Candidatus Latescibacterota bacterium]
MSTVQAAVMTEPGTIEMREFPRPEIGDDEILLKIDQTGICGSDKHMFAGHMTLLFPIIAGHELVGTIEEMGSRAEEAMAVVGGPLQEGDRVTTTPSSTTCGRCWYCLHMPQRPTLCANRYVHGFVSSEVAPAPRGGFSEFMHLTKKSWIFRIPEGLPSDRAVLTEPAAVATRAVERALGPGIPHIGEGLGMDQSVLVMGAGPIGQLVIAVLAHVGTELIIAADLSPSRLDMAKEMGGHHTINASDSLECRTEAVKELTEGVGPAIVIETAGVPIVFKESLDLVRRGGIVVEVGHFTDPGGVDIHPNIVCFKDLDIRGMWAYPAIQFKTAMSFLKNTTAPLDEFITHRLSLAETEKGIDITGSEGSMKVVVTP